MKKKHSYLSLLILLIAPFPDIIEGQVSAHSPEKPITIAHLSSSTKDDSTYLSLQAQFKLPDFLITAIDTGIKLTFVADIEILKQRKLLPNKKILGLEWRKRLHFYALTRHYVVEDLAFNQQANFNSLENALAFLGRYDDIPLVEQPLSTLSEATHTRLRVKLSRADLPLPLRLKSYIHFPRPLSSDWYQWSL